jgi:hypothetical protein
MRQCAWLRDYLIKFIIIGDKINASKRGAQSLNNSLSNTPNKPVRSKVPKPNDFKEGKKEENSTEIQAMFEHIMNKAW